MFAIRRFVVAIILLTELSQGTGSIPPRWRVDDFASPILPLRYRQRVASQTQAGMQTVRSGAVALAALVGNARIPSGIDGYELSWMQNPPSTGNGTVIHLRIQRKAL